MKLLSKAFNMLTNTYFYKLIMIVIAFLYVFPYTMSLTSQALKYFLIWGFIVVIVTYFKDNNFFNNKINWFLAGFLLLSLIGVISNFKNNFIRDIFDWCYLVIFCLAFIYVDKNKKKESIYKELIGISYLIIFISFIVSFSSFILYIFNVKNSIIVQGQGYYFGVFENRLFGSLGNPNSGAILSLVSIFASFIIIYLNKINSKKLLNKYFRKFIYFNAVLQFIVLFLSNSRSAMVSIIVGSTIVFYVFGKKIFTNKIKNNILKTIACFLLVLVGCSSLFGVSILSNKIIGYIPMAVSYIKIELADNNTKDNEKNLKPSNNKRIYKTEDISNGRYDIWLSDLKVAKQYIFTGVGSSNIINKVNLYLPKKSKIASNTHNIYLQVLVGSGIFPLIMLLVYFGSILIMGMKKILESEYEDKYVYNFVLGLILAIMIENLFDSNLIGFMNLLIVPIFWSYIGYIVNFINRQEKLINCEKDIIPD